jgi:hypothetical protein
VVVKRAVFSFTACSRQNLVDKQVGPALCEPDSKFWRRLKSEMKPILREGVDGKGKKKLS